MCLITKSLLCAEIIQVPVSKEMTVWATQWQRNWVSTLTKVEVVIKEGKTPDSESLHDYVFF